MADQEGGRRRGRGRGRGAPPMASPTSSIPSVGRGKIKETAPIPLSVPLTQQMGALSVGEQSGSGDCGDQSRGRGSIRSGRSYIEGQLLNTRPDCAKDTKKGVSGKTVTFQANYFELIKTLNWSLYRYHVDFNPAEERTKMRKIFLREHRERLGMYVFDGSTIFSIQNICPNGNPVELFSKRLSDNENIRISIQFTGPVENSDDQTRQVMNIILRECMSKMQLQLIRRNYYDKQACVSIREHNLDLWPGYITAMNQCENSILLQTEIVYKVLRRDTAYHLFREITNRPGPKGYKNEFCTAIIGATVMTKYIERTYRIDDVDFSKTPKDTFPQSTKDGERRISYQEYYEQKYGVRINDLKQPMLISKTKARERRGGMSDLVYLVPELCIMTGLTDDMRSNYQLMKAVAEYTSVGPSDRVKRLETYRNRLMSNAEVRKKFTEWGLGLGENLINIEGRILPPEEVVFGENKKAFPGSDMDWSRSLRCNPMLISAKLTKWVIICPSALKYYAGVLGDMIQKCGRGMSFNAQPYRIHEIESDRTSSYVQGIEEAVNQYNPELLVFVVPNNRSDRYSAIKKKTICDKSIPSQVVLVKNIKAKSAMSIATNITIQINCKIGGAPWGIMNPMKGGMVIGFDVCHDPKDKRRSFGGFVASLDPLFGRYFSTVNVHASGDELSASFGPNIKKAIARYQEKNEGRLPSPIILYRDGVGDGDLANVYEVEVGDIRKALEPIYKSKGEPLRLAVIVVTKRINTRIFYNRQNPPPGSVVDDVITNPNRFDFYLVSQSVRVGTVSPTHYNVIYDSINWPVDRYQRITYKLCYMYYNWSGTIAVPAPGQYAHKLAFLISQNVGVAHSNLDELLYFL